MGRVLGVASSCPCHVPAKLTAVDIYVDAGGDDFRQMQVVDLAADNYTERVNRSSVGLPLRLAWNGFDGISTPKPGRSRSA